MLIDRKIEKTFQRECGTERPLTYFSGRRVFDLICRLFISPYKVLIHSFIDSINYNSIKNLSGKGASHA